MRATTPTLIILCALPLAPAMADGGIYSFTDEHGTVHYSNVPDDSRYRLLIAGTSPSTGAPDMKVLLQRSQAYMPIIKHAAQANRLDPALVRAVIVAESACDPEAISKRGARGLMQLMPETARQYGVRNAFDPEQNIHAGSRYLRELSDRYQNDLQLVLAAYNAGPAAVDSRGRHVPQFRETLDYVPKVLRIYRRLVEMTSVG
ncbi:MAG: transglycosylase SLT domain-containing protein [Proteobacteria bacterium]|nr:transglycosylase SLT domain-containing protein [Pseudomonadota bacterium]